MPPPDLNRSRLYLLNHLLGEQFKVLAEGVRDVLRVPVQTLFPRKIVPPTIEEIPAYPPDQNQL